MFRNRFVLLLAICGALLGQTSIMGYPESAGAPDCYVEKINQVPDLCQTNPLASFPEGGKEYCCLVAISNSLMWLDANGYPDIVDNKDDPFSSQVALVNLLASSKYMNTSLIHGTGTTKIMRGIKKYVEDRGYSIKKLEYQGWRKHPPEMKAERPCPSVDWIKRMTFGNGSVWLNVGWYRYSRPDNTYERISGHWVTVVGYGRDEKGDPDANILIIHDPSSRSGIAFSNEYVRVQPITSGKLTGQWIGLPRQAKGYLKLGRGIRIKKSANSAIIDGAVALVLNKPAVPLQEKQVAPGKKGGVSTYSDSKTPPTTSEVQALRMLNQARKSLKGQDKDLAGAQDLLMNLVNTYKDSLTPTDLCYVYVYLGYIEDLRGRREQAKEWFNKAMPLDGPKIKGIRSVAEAGLTRPIVKIRHLGDFAERPRGQQKAEQLTTGERIIARVGKGFVLADPPSNRAVRMDLSESEQKENFEILAKAIDEYYPFFEHKNIAWDQIVSLYRAEVRNVKTSRGFYLELEKFTRELKDFHSWLDNFREVPRLGSCTPAISTRLIEGQAVVTEVKRGSQAYQKGVRSGWIVRSINGRSVKRVIPRMKARMHVYSSERAFLEQAYRQLLCGQEGSEITIGFVTQGEHRIRKVRLKRTHGYSNSLPEPSFPTTKGEFVWFGEHPDGYGYIRILSFRGRQEIADEFDRALEVLRHTPRLLIDVRDNPGGYGTSHLRIIGRLITQKSPGEISFLKNGPQHDDFVREQRYFKPVGDWQYTRPVALLINPVTGSASDLFVASLVSTGRVVTMGRTTHGNSTGSCVYVLLPCDLVVRVSRGYICDAKGRIIEANGTKPDILIEPTLSDVLKGKDGVLERAFNELKRLSF